MDTLATIVKDDICSFLEGNKELLFNERDFQMHLATYLSNTKKYDDVDVEYYVPFTELDNYIWKNELRIDIVVRKGQEYLKIQNQESETKNLTLWRRINAGRSNEKSRCTRFRKV